MESMALLTMTRSWEECHECEMVAKLSTKDSEVSQIVQQTNFSAKNSGIGCDGVRMFQSEVQ